MTHIPIILIIDQRRQDSQHLTKNRVSKIPKNQIYFSMISISRNKLIVSILISSRNLSDSLPNKSKDKNLIINRSKNHKHKTILTNHKIIN